jgi:hypothetical protein
VRAPDTQYFWSIRDDLWRELQRVYYRDLCRIAAASRMPFAFLSPSSISRARFAIASFADSSRFYVDGALAK